MDKFSIEELKERDFFIDLSEPFSEVKSWIVSRSKDNHNELVVFAFDYPNDPIIRPLSKYDGEVFLDFIGRKDLKGHLKEMSRKFSQNVGDLFTFIYNNDYQKVKVQALVKHWGEITTFDDKEAEAVIKLMIAKGFLSFESQKGGEFIKLATPLLNIENKKRFLEAIADEIVSRSKRVELLVKHSVSKGSYREILFRSVLQKYIPKRYEVATGFIEGCSRQCDVIIYDSHNYSPFFDEGGLVVVPGKSVRAIIEIKSTLSNNELKDSLDLLAEVATQRNYPAPIFKAIFAFGKGYDKQEIMADAVYEFYNTINDDPKKDFTIDYLYEAINAICVLNQQCLVTDVIDYTYQDKTVRPRIYSIQSSKHIQIFSATFFNELFSYLDVEKHAKKINIDYFKVLNSDMHYHLYKPIYDSDWKPKSSFKNEHFWDQTSLWKRVSDVNNWKSGKYTIQDLEDIYFKEFYQPSDFKEIADNNNIVQGTFSSQSYNSR